MVRFRFKRGLRFFEGTRRWELQKTNAVGLFVFESQDQACERISKSMADVHQLWLSGAWVIDIDSLGPGADVVWHTTPETLSSLPPKKRATAEPRAKVLMAIKAHFDARGMRVTCDPNALVSIVKGRAAEFGLNREPHWGTVWRWWNLLAPTGCMARLANAPNEGRKINAEQYAIFQEVVDEVYLSDQKPPGKAVVEAIQRRYQSLNATLAPEARRSGPSTATVYRWLGNLHYTVVSVARDGKDFNRRERREVVGTLKVLFILERYEIDHTPVDVLLVCSQTWMVLGRPWLTLVIDRHSRMIAGFYIGFHAPSASSVLYALRQSILPKETLLAQFPSVRNAWPVRGSPMTIAMDNGMDLHALAVEQFCLEAMIELRFMGVARPELKGAVERLFGTLSRDLFHNLPGTTFNSVNARGDYPSEQRAALTLETFTEILVKWIVDVYHQTPHRGLKGHTPQSVWQKGEAGTVFSFPAFPRQLDLMVGHGATRTINGYGIDYCRIQYSSVQLLSFRDPKGKPPIVAIKVYEDDVGHIDVKDPETGEYLRVPAVDREYALGLNRHVHDLIREEVRRRFGGSETREQLLMVKAEIQAMVKAAIQGKKAGTRKKASALRLVNSENSLGTRPANALAAANLPMQADIEPELKLHDLRTDELPSFGHLTDRGKS